MLYFISHDRELVHYGTKTHSGRHPWGSGKRPFQRLEQTMQKQHNKIRDTLQNRIKEASDKQKYKSIKRNARGMKSEDIQAMVNRLKMEREMKDLIDYNIAPKRTTVKKTIGAALTKAGGQAIENAGRDIMSKTLYWTYGQIMNENSDRKNSNLPTLSEYLFNQKPNDAPVRDYSQLEKELSRTFKAMKMDKETANNLVRNTVNRAKLDAQLSDMKMDKDARKSLLDDVFKKSSNKNGK